MKNNNVIKQELTIFFTALMFYTRIPCPVNTNFSPELINKATRYFPLVGWIVGILSFFAYWLASMLFNPSIAIVFSLIVGILVTGAFHEDGLADVFDGFGGGWNKENILTIMKDSQIGAYGAIALVMLFLLKFTALEALLNDVNYLGLILLSFISYHSLARLTAINVAFISTYSRDDETSKVKPIAKTHGTKEIFWAYCFGLLPLFLLCMLSGIFVLVIVPLIVLTLFAKRYFEKWIDGYTGDCLGAVEQIAECIIILSFVTIWKYM